MRKIEPSGIFHYDCREGMLKIAEGSARLVLADPPYAVARKNNLETMGRTSIDFPWDGELDHETWIKIAKHLLMPWGSIVIWYDFWRLGEIKDLLEGMGFDVKRAIIYVKLNPMPRNKSRSPTQTFEAAVWAVKKSSKKPKWHFDVREEVSYETFYWEEVLPLDDESECLVFKAGVPRLRRQDPRHEALKPANVYRDLIRILTKPGELVVDPFAGQGTVAVAAEALGRKHISFEKDEAWSGEAIARLGRLRGAE